MREGPPRMLWYLAPRWQWQCAVGLKPIVMHGISLYGLIKGNPALDIKSGAEQQRKRRARETPQERAWRREDGRMRKQRAKQRALADNA